jgi:hypothetical protein
MKSFIRRQNRAFSQKKRAANTVAPANQTNAASAIQSTLFIKGCTVGPTEVAGKGGMAATRCRAGWFSTGTSRSGGAELSGDFDHTATTETASFLRPADSVIAGPFFTREAFDRLKMLNPLVGVIGITKRTSSRNQSP